MNTMRAKVKFWRVILTLINFMDNWKGRVSDEDQSQAHNKNYFKDNFIVNHFMFSNKDEKITCTLLWRS
jgi:hypothetical protein